jgi:hypothetical protein
MIGGMDSQRPTAPPADPVDYEKLQKELTKSLTDHPDPNVRLIAMMSDRQLDMSFRISQFAETQNAILSGIKILEKEMTGLGRRFSVVEQAQEDLSAKQKDLEEKVEELRSSESMNGQPV